MALRPLVREINKPIENQGPIATGGFYSRKIILTEWDKRYIQAQWNFIPLKHRGKAEVSSRLPSTERQG